MPTPAKTLAALRQLCRLGLPAKLVLPEAVTLLRSAVGFEPLPYFYLDTNCRLTDTHVPSEVPLALLLDYGENFYNRPQGEGVTGVTTATAMRSGLPIIQTSKLVDQNAVRRSEFWQRIMHPMGVGWLSLMPLTTQTGGALIIVARRPNSRDFRPADLDLLTQAQPWLVHALAAPDLDDSGEPILPTGDSALLIVDAAGRIVSASSGAVAMLHEAAAEPLANAALRRTVNGNVSALLQGVMHSALDAANSHSAMPPSRVIRNNRGVFRIRSYPLTPSTYGTPLQFSIVIERQLPLSARLFRSPQFLALPMRERDVCLGILAGKSNTQIASELGIKPSSVLHHTRMLYLRLDVRGQKDLLLALLKGMAS